MRSTIFTLIIFFSIHNIKACEFFNYDNKKNIHTLMGKKSKFYDAYMQGKCVLENALRPLTIEQREVIANLIAKTYKLEN